MSMTKDQVLTVLDVAIEHRRERRLHINAPDAHEQSLRQARAAIASWPEPGEAVAWLNRKYWTLHFCGPDDQASGAMEAGELTPLYERPQSMTALLAELRGLDEKWRLRTHGYSPFDDCADELAAILSRYPEAK